MKLVLWKAIDDALRPLSIKIDALPVHPVRLCALIRPAAAEYAIRARPGLRRHHIPPWSADLARRSRKSPFRAAWGFTFGWREV
jgi:hypothetical protein